MIYAVRGLFPFVCPSSSSFLFNSISVLRSFLIIISLCNPDYVEVIILHSLWRSEGKMKFFVILQIWLKKKTENKKKNVSQCSFIDAQLLVMNVHTYCGRRSRFFHTLADINSILWLLLTCTTDQTPKCVWERERIHIGLISFGLEQN